MAIYILATGSEATKAAVVEQRIRRAIPDAMPVASIQELLDKIEPGQTDPVYLLIVVPSDPRGYFTKLAESTASRRACIFFLLISDELSASDYKALVRRGDADWVSIDADPQRLSTSLLAIAE
jgi:hypothetical protein